MRTKICSCSYRQPVSATDVFFRISFYGSIIRANLLYWQVDPQFDFLKLCCLRVTGHKDCRLDSPTCIATGKSFCASGGKNTSTAFLEKGWLPVGGLPASMMWSYKRKIRKECQKIWIGVAHCLPLEGVHLFLAGGVSFWLKGLKQGSKFKGICWNNCNSNF